MRFCYMDLDGLCEKKIHIDEYKDHMSGKIYCAEGHLVVAKRGKQRVHHFAHKSGTLCSCHDNKGDWHIGSQNRVIKEAQEYRFVCKLNQDNINSKKLHIADVFVDKKYYTEKMTKFTSYDGIVIEYQHSPMTQDVMIKRENFYTGVSTKLKNHLVWIFDVTNWEYQIIRKPLPSNKELLMRKKKGHDFPLLGSYTGHVTKILDFGKYDLLVVTKQQGASITGYIITIDEFDEFYLGKAISSISDSRHNRSSICQ